MIILIMSVLMVSIYQSFNVQTGGLETLMTSSLQKPPFRGIFSTIYFLFFYLLIFLPIALKINSGNFEKILIVFFYSGLFVASISIFLSFLGLISPVFYNIVDFFSLDSTKQFELEPGSSINFRPSFFSSEPKYFGLAFSNLLFFSALQRYFKLPNIPKWASSYLFMIVCVFLLILSASLTALVVFILAVFCSFFSLIYDKSKLKAILFLFVGFLFVTIFLVYQFSIESFLADRINNYSTLIGAGFDDQTSAGLSTSAYLFWLLDQPENLIFGVGLGNGAFYAHDYVFSMSGFYTTGFTSSRVPILDLLSGVGVTGVFCIYLLVFLWLKKINHAIRNLANSNKIKPHFLFIKYSLIYYIIGGFIYNAYIHLFIFIGIGLSFCILINSQKIPSKL